MNGENGQEPGTAPKRPPDPEIADRDFGPDLSETSLLKRRLMGLAVIAALVGLVVYSVFSR